MCLDAALVGPAETWPTGTALRHSEIVVESSGKQLVLETELLLALSQSFFVAEPVGKRGVEQILDNDWAGRCSLAYERVDLYWEPLAMPRCT